MCHGQDAYKSILGDGQGVISPNGNRYGIKTTIRGWPRRIDPTFWRTCMGPPHLAWWLPCPLSQLHEFYPPVSPNMASWEFAWKYVNETFIYKWAIVYCHVWVPEAITAKLLLFWWHETNLLGYASQFVRDQ
jgi:hypothetical protein